MKYPIKYQNEGFTIVELMIATAVLSVILLIATVLITNINNLYYKGISESQVQDDVRSTNDRIQQDLQLAQSSPQGPGTGVAFSGVKFYAYCIDSVRYSYVTGIRNGDATGSGGIIQHALWRDNLAAGSVCAPADLSQSDPDSSATLYGTVVGKDGTELIGPNSQLTNFGISSASPYAIQIGVAYGDSSLLTGSGANTHCVSGSGNQFCGVDNLMTVVTPRISGGALQ